MFDKTGTITRGAAEVKFMGTLQLQQWEMVKSLTTASSHPLSNLISKSIKGTVKNEVEGFKEISGKGIEGIVNESRVRIGSASYLSVLRVTSDKDSLVFVEINDEVKGYFQIGTSVRKDLPFLLKNLDTYFVALLSGDHDGEREKMSELFPATTPLMFDQNPHDKLTYISNLQKQGRKVMMIGDGLNDSGALKQSDVGIAVSDDTGVFTPACDGILEGKNLKHLDAFMWLSRKSTIILRVAFAISFFYNFITLSIAVSGHLTPLVAAVLMPISSISVVGFSSMAVNMVAKIKLDDLTKSKG